MSLATSRELFVHGLSDSMNAEQVVLGMLGQLARETKNKDVKAAVEHHHVETKQQIKNLEKVFKILGETPEDTTCYAAEGLKKEHEALKEESPAPLVLEFGNLAGAAKTEHYEIASYNALIQMARHLGEREIVPLLKENLDQEKEMARKIESFAREMGKDIKAEMKKVESAQA